MTDLTPREIVSELDRNIVGQNDAKARCSCCHAQPVAPQTIAR
jgi:ATP-dependent protease HslVU (ClpYQ) ATPase subunit